MNVENDSSYNYTSEESEVIESEVIESNEDAGEWIELKENNDYEIFNKFPFAIRKKGSDKPIKETFNNRNKYYCCTLNKKTYLKHRLIAKQFLENPNDYRCIDHVNHVRTDNRLENLRWVSNRQNSNNQSIQTFVETISEDSIKVEDYNGYEFEFLYFHEDVFYVYNGINYVIKPKYLSQRGYYCIKLRDKSGKQRAIYFNKFKKQYGLI